MIEITIQKMASDVAALLGETLAEESHPEESPFPRLADRVRILAPGLLAKLILEATPDSFTGGDPITATPVPGENGSGWLKLPNDFLRLVSIRVSSWKRSVTEITSRGDPDSLRQESEWTGIRGSRTRPVVTSCFDADGNRCLWLHPFETGDMVEHALYLPMPSRDASILRLPKLLHPALLSTLIAHC